MNKINEFKVADAQPKSIVKQYMIVYILAALLLIAVIAAVIFYKRSKVAESKVKTGQKTVSQAAKIISRYVDSSGRQHAAIEADANALPPNWYKNGTAISGGLIDTVAKALNIARKQLQEVTQIATVSQAKALRAEQTIDSLKRVTYYYKDKYLQLAYRPATNRLDTADHGQFDFQYNDSLNVVQYSKRKWLLGAKKSYIDIYSNDPRTRVNGVKRLSVQQREPVFGLRIQGAANYSFSRRLLNVGPGVQFDINRFSLIGNYYYDFDANKFRPTVGARWDLVRF